MKSADCCYPNTTKRLCQWGRSSRCNHCFSREGRLWKRENYCWHSSRLDQGIQKYAVMHTVQRQAVCWPSPDNLGTARKVVLAVDLIVTTFHGIGVTPYIDMVLLITIPSISEFCQHRSVLLSLESQASPCQWDLLHCSQVSSYLKIFLRCDRYTISHCLKLPSFAVAMVIESAKVPVPTAFSASIQTFLQC